MGEGLGGSPLTFVMLLILLALAVACYLLFRSLAELKRPPARDAAPAPPPPFWRTLIVQTLLVVGVLANLLALFQFFTGIPSLPLPPADEPTAFAPPSSPAPPPAATPERSPLRLLPLRRYTDPSESFSLLVPAEWERDLRDMGPYEVAVLFQPVVADERYSAFIGVNTIPVGLQVSQERMIEELTELIGQQFQPLFPSFDQDAEVLGDGSVRLTWRFDAQFQSGASVPMRGVSWIWQADGQLGVLTVAVPEADYAALEAVILDIRASCRIGAPTR